MEILGQLILEKKYHHRERIYDLEKEIKELSKINDYDHTEKDGFENDFDDLQEEEKIFLRTHPQNTAKKIFKKKTGTRKFYHMIILL